MALHRDRRAGRGGDRRGCRRSRCSVPSAVPTAAPTARRRPHCSAPHYVAAANPTPFLTREVGRRVWRLRRIRPDGRPTVTPTAAPTAAPTPAPTAVPTAAPPTCIVMQPRSQMPFLAREDGRLALRLQPPSHAVHTPARRAHTPASRALRGNDTSPASSSLPLLVSSDASYVSSSLSTRYPSRYPLLVAPAPQSLSSSRSSSVSSRNHHHHAAAWAPSRALPRRHPPARLQLELHLAWPPWRSSAASSPWIAS